MSSQIDTVDSAEAEPPPATAAIQHTAIQPVFAGDRGQLPLDVRRAYLQLVRGPYIDGRRHTKLWPVLLANEETIRSRLHELLLELVVDREEQVAFNRQVVDENVSDLPILLRKHRFNLLQSVLALYLRQQLLSSSARGERAVVQEEDMEMYMQAYRRSDDRDEAQFKRRVTKAIEGLKAVHVIQEIEGSKGRYQVSPALKIMFSADEIQSLTEVYKRIAAEGGDDSEQEGDVNE
jgi:hypothetical protein